MQTNQSSAEQPKKLFSLLTLKTVGAYAIIGALASMFIEEQATGARSRTACVALEAAFSKAARARIEDRSLYDVPGTFITMEKKLTHEDVKLLFPWSTHKTCRFSYYIPR